MKTGHFYFGKNRTFLNWLDTNFRLLDFSQISIYLSHTFI